MLERRNVSEIVPEERPEDELGLGSSRLGFRPKDVFKAVAQDVHSRVNLLGLHIECWQEPDGLSRPCRQQFTLVSTLGSTLVRAFGQYFGMLDTWQRKLQLHLCCFCRLNGTRCKADRYICLA